MAKQGGKWIRRPNHPYSCGSSGNSSPCQMGPQGRSCGRYLCEPSKREDGGWSCTRPAILGGPCENGPTEEGSCGQKPCLPQMTSYHFRKLVMRWTLTLAIVIILLAGTNPISMSWLNPGALNQNHKFINDCATCHQVKGATPFSILSQFWATKHQGSLDGQAFGISNKCLACHTKGDHPFHPHGLEMDVLVARARKGRQTGESEPLGEKRKEIDHLSCIHCHHEHQGLNSNLTLVDSNQCQTCHESNIDQFSTNHPEFSSGFGLGDYSRIRFDHSNHFSKHFPKMKKGPTHCENCHAFNQPTNFPGFETCSACHREDVSAENSAGLKGLQFWTAPGVDLEALEAYQSIFGQWPAFSEENWSPFVLNLLSSDHETAGLLRKLGKVDWLDLSEATTAQKGIAAEILRRYKLLLWDCKVKGVGLFIEKLGLSNSDGFPIPSEADYNEAIRLWFPNLADESNLLASRDSIDPKSDSDTSEIKREDPKLLSKNDKKTDSEDLSGDLLGASSDDVDELLSDGDLLAEDDIDLTEGEGEVSKPIEKQSVSISVDDRMKWGGWFQDGFSIYYRPSQHPDPFLSFWIPYAENAVQTNKSKTADQILKTVSNPLAPGKCMKCHNRPGERPFDWRQNKVPTGIAVFKHRPHLLAAPDCQDCHMLKKGSSTEEAVLTSEENPKSFLPVFKITCANCHRPGKTQSDCQLCHLYHRQPQDAQVIHSKSFLTSAIRD